MSAPVVEGDVLAGKYRVDKVLGIGGMGVVVAATHITLAEKVALKFMLPAGFNDEEARSRFLREARAARKLKSEHVARVFDVGTLENGAPYIVMEYLAGTDLAGLLEQRALSVAEVAEYVIQACDALAEAHLLGIVHRDLKPANLFLTTRPDGSPLVKVLDFGISKASALGEGGLEMTKSTAMMGSPLYMSPEQMKSSRSVDARADVWSLGVILYQLLAGDVPFTAESLGELMSKVLSDPPPPLAMRRRDVPVPIARLVDACLVKDARGRLADVGQLVQVLAPFAPTRAAPIAERILNLLHRSGLGGTTRLPSDPDLRAVPKSSPGLPAAPPSNATLPLSALPPSSPSAAGGALGAAASTSPEWAKSVRETTAGASGRRAPLALAALAVLAVVGAGGVGASRYLPRSRGAASASASASASGPPSAALQAAIPPRPSAEPAPAPAPAPVLPSAAPSASVPAAGASPARVAGVTAGKPPPKPVAAASPSPAKEAAASPPPPASPPPSATPPPATPPKPVDLLKDTY